MRANILVIAFVALVLGPVIFYANHGLPKEKVVLGNTTFLMDIADTDALQTQGLSGRTSLASTTGMIFVFDTPDTYEFWMKDMKFPLDIIWVSPDMHIINIEKSLATSTYPHAFSPDKPALYVLEISAGQSNALGLKIGDTIQILKK